MSQISVRPAKGADPIEFEINLPELDETNPDAFVEFANENWTDEESGKTGLAVLCAHARSSIVVSAQSYARAMYAKIGTGDDDIDESTCRSLIAEWQPALRRPGKSAVDKAQELFKSMDETQRAAFLQQLQAAE